MKQISSPSSQFFAAAMTSICMTTLFSCTVYHFEYPLPIDTENLKSNPKSLQGIWFNDKGERAFNISKNSIELIDDRRGEEEMFRVYNGIIDSLAQSKGFRGLQHVAFNVEDHKHYNKTGYVIKDDEIYSVEDGKLQLGRAYELKGDTFYVNPAPPRMPHSLKLSFIIDRDYYLRKVSNNRYLINLPEANLLSFCMSNIESWYQVLLFEKAKDGRLMLRMVNSSPDSVKIMHDDGDTYLRCRWNREQVNRAINSNFFSDNQVLYKQGDKRIDSLINRRKNKKK